MHHNKYLTKQGRDWNHGESDHEGSMAVAQLHRLNDISGMLLDFISENDELPGWVQYKLTRAYTDLNDIFGYIEPQADSEMHKMSMPGHTTLQHTQVSEAKKRKRKKKASAQNGLWANIHAKRARGGKPLKPGQKGYPATLDVG